MKRIVFSKCIGPFPLWCKTPRGTDSTNIYAMFAEQCKHGDHTVKVIFAFEPRRIGNWYDSLRRLYRNTDRLESSLYHGCKRSEIFIRSYGRHAGWLGRYRVIFSRDGCARRNCRRQRPVLSVDNRTRRCVHRRYARSTLWKTIKDGRVYNRRIRSGFWSNISAHCPISIFIQLSGFGRFRGKFILRERAFYSNCRQGAFVESSCASLRNCRRHRKLLLDEIYRVLLRCPTGRSFRRSGF